MSLSVLLRLSITISDSLLRRTIGRALWFMDRYEFLLTSCSYAIKRKIALIYRKCCIDKANKL